MDLSVIVCTYNRAGNLPACIGHLARQAGVEDAAWEVLVVDNNSSDGTARVVEALQAEHPIALRYAFEPKQGLSHARNCGIHETASRYVIFIDDDIHVTVGWLRAYVDAFEQRQCDTVGGPIVVRSPRALPGWIRPEMMGFLGGLDYGDAPCALDGDERYPFGGNMAFRRDVLVRLGGFDPALGRKGSGAKADELFKGEETAYFRQLAESGGTICYAPQARVEHHILPYQLSRRFFLTIHYNEGFQAVQRAPSPGGRTLGGVPLFVFRQTLRAVGSFLGATLRHGPDASMRQLMNVAYFMGRIRGHRAHLSRTVST